MKKQMKRSRYNFFVSLGDGRTLMYNALANGLCVVEDRLAERVAGDGPLDDLDPSVRTELARGGFVVPGELDERDVVRVRYRKGQYDGSVVALTIAPTLNCNLACRYCFESPWRGSMDRSTREEVVRFAGELLPRRGGTLAVTWYGGEPLLALGAIEHLGREFRRLCADREATWTASIVTNGTLLDGGTARRLREWGVRDAQVTIDGPRPTHDRRRPFRNGRGSYELIVRNLGEAIGELPLAVRINVDRTNVEDGFRVIRELRAQPWFDPRRMSFYFGYVRRYTPACGCTVEETLELPEFWEVSARLTEMLLAEGLAEMPPYPELAGGCTATSAFSFVVGPRGELYRCWNHVGDESRVVGTVRDPWRPHPLTVAFLVDGFEGDEECLACRFLPLCTGGCVDVRRKAREGQMPGKDCVRWKRGLEDYLRRYFRAWEARQGAREEAR